MKFAALGRTQLLYDSIRICIEAGHDLVMVGTSEAAPEYTRSERDFELLAQDLGCPFVCDSRINRRRYLALIRETEAEVAISVNWPTLMERKALLCFKYGIINAHAGDLPRFRGNACPNWAILSGERKIVITLHQMVEALDAGPILLQEAFPLTEETYVRDFYRFAEERIPIMFARVLDALAEGTIVFQEQPQDPGLSLRCFPRLAGDGRIDWKVPAEDISRLVRASSEPFSGAFTYLGREKLIVWRARSGRLPYPWLGMPGHVVDVDRNTGEATVLAGEGVVVLEEIETASKGKKPAAEILTSTRMRLGMDLSKLLNLF